MCYLVLWNRVAKYNIWSNHILARFKLLHGKMEVMNATKLNYGEWVWYFDNGHQLVHLMFLVIVAAQSLGLASRWIFHLQWLVWCLVLLCAGENGGNLHGHEGKGSFGFKVFWWFGIDAFKHCHTSHLVCGWLQVLGSVESIVVQSSSPVPVWYQWYKVILPTS